MRQRSDHGWSCLRNTGAACWNTQTNCCRCWVILSRYGTTWYPPLLSFELGSRLSSWEINPQLFLSHSCRPSEGMFRWRCLTRVEAVEIPLKPACSCRRLISCVWNWTFVTLLQDWIFYRRFTSGSLQKPFLFQGIDSNCEGPYSWILL